MTALFWWAKGRRPLGPPKSFAAKVLNPKKRKPDPETAGENLPQNPVAKRKPDGASETSRGSVSASPSASHDQTPMELDTQSGSIGRSTPGALLPTRGASG